MWYTTIKILFIWLQVRYASISYATSIRYDFGFDFSPDKAVVEQAIWDLPHMAGSTNIADALRLVTKLFEEKGRGDASHIAVVLVDEVSNVEPDSVSSLAQEARDQGVHIYCVGADLHQDALLQIRSMVSQPVSKYLFYGPRITNMVDIVQPTVTQTCQTGDHWYKTQY